MAVFTKDPRLDSNFLREGRGRCATRTGLLSDPSAGIRKMAAEVLEEICDVSNAGEHGLYDLLFSDPDETVLNICSKRQARN